MILSRNGQTPYIDPSAKVATSAQIVGNVTIGERSFIDHNVVIESSGPPIHVADHVIVFTNSVIRSVGGTMRPAFPVEIGNHTMIAPLCVLTGCRVGRLCYVATGAIILQGATIGDNSLIGVGAIVHFNTNLSNDARVGLRQIAVGGDTGALITSDVGAARGRLRETDFFEEAFGVPQETEGLHQRLIEKLLDEVWQWVDEPFPLRNHTELP
jgi:carbonic anhydrase/acetyltransferase-like protein (isoleucine patch superfamily)